MKRIIDFILLNRTSMLLFVIVGTSTAAIYFLTFGLLWNMLAINYRIGVSVAYILSTTFHFFANRHFTFKGQNIKLAHQLPKYLAMVVINYVVTLLIVSFVVEFLQFTPYLGICAAVSVTLVMTYLLSYFWVFGSSLKYSRR